MFQLLISFLACTGFNMVLKSLSLTCLQSLQVSTPRSDSVTRTNRSCSVDKVGISSIDSSAISLSMLTANIYLTISKSIFCKKTLIVLLLTVDNNLADS